MTAFVFLISFLLHIIAFATIAQLFKQIKQLKKQNESEDIEELLETYLQEIKKENRVLEEKLNNSSIQKTTQIIDEPKQKQKNLVNGNNDNSQPPIDVAEKSIIAPEIEADDTSETSLQAKILQLHVQGLSHEEIAKKLNCGKTETELIIKLHAKNNY